MSKTAPPIHNIGKIILEITADSGYWRDIQDAVNLAASSGVGIVHIPEGTRNFVNVGESWTGARVVVPAGVSIFGAATERYPKGSVVEWKTILVMPWDVPSGVTWFQISGNSDPNKPSRFSDIKLVGYRSFNPDSTTKHIGLQINEVINFRVDHCCFEHICGGGVSTQGHYCSGVIDHCVFDNPVGKYGLTIDESTVVYGVCVFRSYYPSEKEWEPDITKVLGKYLNYTVFVEDCYFTKWRSAVVGNLGAHYVVRHCIFTKNLATGEVDAHTTWYPEDYVGNRAAEVYDCYFGQPAEVQGVSAIEFYGGGGVIFNNTVESGYPCFLEMGDGTGTYDPHDLYIWNNTLAQGVDFKWGAGQENVNYVLYKPDWYTPYPYPHPLTLK